MKKLLTALLALVLALTCVCVFALQTNAAKAGDYTYSVDDGKATITDYTGAGGNIAIPSSLGGYPVTAIGESAFRQAALRKVTIPKGVTTIGDSAFAGCYIMTSVSIPGTVKTIGGGAFSGCTSLSSVVIPDSVTTIGYAAFAQCDALNVILIGSGVTTIENYAFSNCSDQSHVYIQDPSAWCKISFGGDSSNPLYNGGTLHIWDENRQEVTDVVLDNTVTSIPAYAFRYCGYMTSVTIPASVHTVWDSAFYWCYNLKDVYYAGTEVDWQCLFIGDDNSPLTDAKIHYDHTHDYSLFPAVTVAATCTQAGYIEYTCAYGEKYQKILPQLSHDYSGAEITVAPTCTEVGYTGIPCIHCADVQKKNTVPALGHDYTGTKTVVAPTCFDGGYTNVGCTRCSSVEKQNEVPKLDHKMVVVPAVAPTCTETGLTSGTACEYCHKVGISQTVVPATGHSFVEGVCTVCGELSYIPGDLDGVAGINEGDAIYLLQHVIMPDLFAVDQPVDFNGDGELSTDDAVYLLQHILMPELFPLR